MYTVCCMLYALCNALHVVFLLETGERFNLWKIIIITKRFDWNNLWFVRFFFFFFILYNGNRERRTIWIIGEERSTGGMYNTEEIKADERKKRFYRRFS